MVEIRTVAVLDDDVRVLDACRRALHREHKTVFTAVDAVSARTLVRRERPDLAVVDLRLGTTSGVDLIREFRRDLPAINLALVSGYLSVACAVDAVRAGADLVLSKPVGAREILQRLEHGTSSQTVELDQTPTLKRVEWEHINRVIADCGGNLTRAAKRLGIYRQALYRRLKKDAPRV